PVDRRETLRATGAQACRDGGTACTTLAHFDRSHGGEAERVWCVHLRFAARRSAFCISAAASSRLLLPAALGPGNAAVVVSGCAPRRRHSSRPPPPSARMPPIVPAISGVLAPATVTGIDAAPAAACGFGASPGIASAGKSATVT